LPPAFKTVRFLVVLETNNSTVGFCAALRMTIENQLDPQQVRTPVALGLA
jgi:hypothetical protein